MRMHLRHCLVLPLLAATAACATMPFGPPAARLTNSGGFDIGTVRAWDGPGGVIIDVAAAGLQPGPHGIHVHTTGRCDRPAFTTAGPHWNPTNMKHGHQNPAGPHRGDLSNLVVGPDGRVRTRLVLAGATLRGPEVGPGAALLDHDGAAVVIHAKADDDRTDPSGNSGDRIACAIIGGR